VPLVQLIGALRQRCEHVLSCIFGVMSMSRDTAANAENHTAVASDYFLERLAVVACREAT
jgi:ribose 1,5-bisphosphokinase PhnN